MRLPSLLLFLFLAAVVRAEPSPPPAEATPTPASKSAEDFDIPVPVGMPVKGIKIPHRNENGDLVMVLEAETAKKLDDTRVEMEKLRIEAFDDEGKKIFVEMPHSVFDLQTRVLTGDKSALIRRDDFEITGDAVEFSTKTRNGTVRGNVKMTILTENADSQ